MDPSISLTSPDELSRAANKTPPLATQGCRCVQRRTARTPRREGDEDGDSDGGDGSDGGVVGDDDDDDEGWADVDEPWVPRYSESLFDGHESATFEANVQRMRVAQSFFVPTAGLDDVYGLFAFLQEKICARHTCICCHRSFETLEGVRDHMSAKGHCRLSLDDRRSLLELAPFYDPTHPSWPGAKKVGYIDGLGELVLPSGRTLGARTLRQVYRQKFQPDDNRVSVVAARRVAQRLQLRNMGYGMRGSRVRASSSRLHSDTLASAHDALAAKVALRAEAVKRHQMVLSSMAFHKGTSKAIASQYVFKASFADNKHARALTHHGYGGFGGGAHYTMAGSKQFQKGVRVKGVVSRHSVQGARTGAARRSKAAAKSGGSGHQVRNAS